MKVKFKIPANTEINLNGSELSISNQDIKINENCGKILCRNSQLILAQQVEIYGLKTKITKLEAPYENKNQFPTDLDIEKSSKYSRKMYPDKTIEYYQPKYEGHYL